MDKDKLRKITLEELRKVLILHKLWIGGGIGGARADLSYTDLSRLELWNQDLRKADLSCADLTGADLTGSDLAGALLTDTILTDTNLTGVDLFGAKHNEKNLGDAYIVRGGVRIYFGGKSRAKL